jgi:CubicO group peptidase (beta-lactamase class C family)
MSVSKFMSSRLWQPLGAEADASWSLDSTADGFEKMESGINARPVDFARFGLMMLHNGTWNGHRIVSSAWVREATAVDTTTDPADFYQYMWWVTPRAGADRSPFFAMGKYGQLIGVFPQQDTVVVRLGSDYGDVDWQAVLTRMADQIAAR